MISIAARVLVDKDSFVGHRLKFATPVEFVDLTKAFVAENSKFGEVWIFDQSISHRVCRTRWIQE